MDESKILWYILTAIGGVTFSMIGKIIWDFLSGGRVKSEETFNKIFIGHDE